jgi:hypothetical protein
MFSTMSEIFCPGSLNGSGDRVIDSLMSFFTDPGDWAYVLGYDRCGVVGAMVTHQEGEGVLSSLLKRKRIVLELWDGTLYSVIRLGTTPAGLWEACELDTTGNELIGDPGYYTTPELFDTFSRHADKP